MADADARTRAERLASAIAERKRREARALQSDLGKPGRMGGLIWFIRHFWHVLEPNTKLVEGWAMYAICMHLEAVTRGEIKRLLINVPPGFAKSMIVNVFWPAWEWSAAGQPYHRYVTFAYASHLTERDNGRFRDIVQCHEFVALWGHVVRLTSNGVIKPTNTAKGWKFSSSIDGVGTGERGSRVLCLPYREMVHTENGPMCIGDIVTTRWAGRVWSRTDDGDYELRHVRGWYRNPASPVVKVELRDGSSVLCTRNHRVMTSAGWVAAGDLSKGAFLPTIRKNRQPGSDGPENLSRPNLINGVLRGAVLCGDVNGATRRKVDFLDNVWVARRHVDFSPWSDASNIGSCHLPRVSSAARAHY